MGLGVGGAACRSIDRSFSLVFGAINRSSVPFSSRFCFVFGVVNISIFPFRGEFLPAISHDNDGTIHFTQAAHRYWHARYRPRRGWRKRQKVNAKRAAARARAAAAAAATATTTVALEGEGHDEQAAQVVGGREGVPDPGSRRQAHRVAELDARLKVRSWGVVLIVCFWACVCLCVLVGFWGLGL